MQQKYFKDVGFTAGELFSVLSGDGLSHGGSYGGPHPLTIKPSSMHGFMGNLDGLVMNVDSLASLSIALIADVEYFDPDNGARAVYSAVCYDAGNPDESVQVETSEYLLNILQFLDSSFDVRHTMNIGDSCRLTLVVKFDEFMNCISTEFTCKPIAALEKQNLSAFGDAFAAKFSSMHGVEVNHHSIIAANELSNLVTLGAVLAVRSVSVDSPDFAIKGVMLDAPCVDDTGLDLAQNHEIDIYYDLRRGKNIVLCLVYDKQSGVTYAKSNVNDMMRMYVTRESAKLAECSNWPSNRVMVDGLGHQKNPFPTCKNCDDGSNGFQGNHRPIEIDYKPISIFDELGTYSEDFVGFEDKLGGV